jgi:hypothetical protein
VDCHNYQENLTAYLQGELHLKEVMELHAHLGICETCAREERELRQTLYLLSKYHPITLPENFNRQLNLRLKNIKPINQKRQWPSKRMLFTIAATLLVTIGLEFLAYQIFQESKVQDSLTSLTKTAQNFRIENYARFNRPGNETEYLKKYASYIHKFYPETNKSNNFRNEMLQKN